MVYVGVECSVCLLPPDMLTPWFLGATARRNSHRCCDRAHTYSILTPFFSWKLDLTDGVTEAFHTLYVYTFDDIVTSIAEFRRVSCELCRRV